MDETTKLIFELGRKVAAIEAKVGLLIWFNTGIIGLMGVDFFNRVFKRLGNGKSDKS